MRKLRADQVRADMVRLLTAQLYLKDGSPEQAARELDSLQDPAAGPDFLHSLCGEVHHRRGQVEQAVAAYAKVAGALTAYHCTVCGRTSLEWKGYCTYCCAWDSYRSAVEIGVL